MSIPEVDLNEELWQKYINYCLIRREKPSHKDFLVWCEDNDYDNKTGEA